MRAETLSSLFHAQAAHLSEKPLLQVKQDGVYHDVLWKDVAEHVREIAGGLLAQGVQPGDRVGILSENRQEWIEADFAILSIGAITVALHAPLSAAQVSAQFQDCTPVAAFVSTEAQRDKLLSVHDELPSIRHIFAFEESAANEDAPSLTSLMAEGRAWLVAHPNELQTRIEAVRPADVAAIIYTSGTTGDSKGAMLTHSNFVSNTWASAERLCTTLGEGSVVLVFLPLSHVYARTCDLYLGVAAGRVLGLSEGVDTLLADLQAIRPQSMLGVPRMYEKFVTCAQPGLQAGNKDALREVFGGRIYQVWSGGAALSPEVVRYYQEAGIPVYQGYGLTETSPVISTNYEGANRIGSSGKAETGVEIKIAEDGEILSRGPHIMKGYWNKPEATAEVIDSEGWFHTGDVGKIDEDGYLYITDRKKDIFVTAYGKNIAPQQVEGLLGFDLFIEHACVYGDGKKYLTAVIVPSEPALCAWAQKVGLASKPMEELVTLPQVHAFYEQRIAQALHDLAPYEQVKKFLLLPKPFSHADGHMTVTAKLRRKQIVAAYREALDALYED